MDVRARFREILNEHDPYHDGSDVVCGCGRKFAPGKVVHLSNWSRHVADLLLDAQGVSPCGSR